MNSDKDKKFVERPFQEVEGGEYDENGFYYTPEGSKIQNQLIYLNYFRFLGCRWCILQSRTC
jgi:hypothetical protein